MQKDEIALQLTLKSIEHLCSPNISEEHNSKFAKEVCDFYNYLYQNLDNSIQV